MKYFFFVIVSTTLFFSFSPGHLTPAIVGSHDKLAHFSAFFVLSFGMINSFPSLPIKRIFLTMALLAMGIEFIQHFISNRQLSIVDFGAGLAGIFAYLITLKVINRMNNDSGETLKFLHDDSC